jgi:hypothetical protein
MRSAASLDATPSHTPLRSRTSSSLANSGFHCSGRPRSRRPFCCSYVKKLMLMAVFPGRGGGLVGAARRRG